MKPIDPDLRGCFLADQSGRAPAWLQRRIDPILPSGVFASARIASPVTRLRATDTGPARRVARSARGRTTQLLRRGALIDKYRIVDVLGMGGFAVVYRATHLLLQTPVAIKLLRPEVLSARPGIEAQLIIEARFAARISHPNVVRIYDITHSAELTYIVMEYIDGSTLSKQLSVRGRLAPSAVVQIGLHVVAGLRAGLEQGLIHRDIKPANILLSRSGMATIVDYGMAHAAQPENWLEDGAPPAVVGTRGYMAPEQAIDSSRVDFRADVYALGVTLQEAASAQLRTHKPASESPLPPRLSRLLRSMQKPDPRDRPASYDALFDELSAIKMELAGETSEEGSRKERGRASG
ncbi:MAG TPA: serine/threonine-protein kinase [Polyangiaceae bacterium]|nr:serine/threonine-protein kinase [Polyangiaceae bacterium]